MLYVTQLPKTVVAYSIVDIIHYMWINHKPQTKVFQTKNDYALRLASNNGAYKVFEPDNKAKTFTSFVGVYCEISIDLDQHIATIKYINKTIKYQWNAGRWTLLA